MAGMAGGAPRHRQRHLGGHVAQGIGPPDAQLRRHRRPRPSPSDGSTRKGGSVDDERTRLLFTPRRRGSGWSRPNKQRVERLEADGLMAPAGAAVIAAAKADGSWTRLDDVEDLVVPVDLDAAFRRHDGSRAQWDGFPRSARRSILERIVTAKRDETRATRIEETASLAARGERAHQSPRR